MTFFRDLELINYHSGPMSADCWHVPLLAIGWLEKGQPIQAGACSAVVVERLAALREQFAEAFSEFSFRGLHTCTLCDGGEQVLHRSHLNLFIPAQGVIYLATGRVDHYMTEHGYTPPQAFIDAVMQCPDPRTARYAKILLGLNQGNRPPLFSESWNVVKVDQDGGRLRLRASETEAQARRRAEVLASEDPTHAYDVEKAPDRWLGAD